MKQQKIHIQEQMYILKIVEYLNNTYIYIFLNIHSLWEQANLIQILQ